MADDREGRIRDRAYAILEKEGRPHGSHEDHWWQAEQEMSGLDPLADAAPGAWGAAFGEAALGGARSERTTPAQGRMTRLPDWERLHARDT